MYEKCVKCEHLGKDCIPNFYAMDIGEIRDFARKLKEEKGWSNAYLAEVSGVPKGTIDSNFSKNAGKAKDVNYSTFAPVLCALLGNCNAEMPCHCDDNNIIMSLMKNDRLKRQLDEMEETKTEYDERLRYFKEQMRWRKHVIVFLIATCCVLIAFIMAGIAIDWMNNGIGFLWIDK